VTVISLKIPVFIQLIRDDTNTQEIRSHTHTHTHTHTAFNLTQTVTGVFKQVRDGIHMLF